MLTFRSILVAVDLSAGAAEALRYALAMRRGERAVARGARITVAHAAPAESREDAVARLRDFVWEIAGPEPDLATEVLGGDPRTVIPARATDFDLLLAGARSVPVPGEVVPGGVSEAIVRRSPAPVVTVKWLTALSPLAPDAALAPREIVFATDFTSFSAHALRYALGIAFAYDARVTAVHVVPDARELRESGRLPFPLAEAIDRFYEGELGWQKDELGRFLRDRLGAERPVAVREVVRVGRAAPEIARECLEVGADLLVLATHGASGVKRFLLGSTAEAALRQAPCPVLSVRPIDHHPTGVRPAGAPQERRE
jgi:nucleotide-binding universal stress UspA family protein